jgi:hypothetical protein
VHYYLFGSNVTTALEKEQQMARDEQPEKSHHHLPQHGRTERVRTCLNVVVSGGVKSPRLNFARGPCRILCMASWPEDS